MDSINPMHGGCNMLTCCDELHFVEKYRVAAFGSWPWSTEQIMAAELNR